MKRAYIITGGECFADKLIYMPEDTDFVIAADSGYETALKMGVRPNIAIGDMDSIKTEIDENITKFVSPPEKDDTDTMLAIKYAEAEKSEELIIIGGTGGRIDHTVSNIFMLENLKERGISAVLTDGMNIIRVIKNETVRIFPRGYKYFSVTALETCVITETGCKYPLYNAELRRDLPYAVSNEITGEYSEITISGGAAFLMETGR